MKLSATSGETPAELQFTVDAEQLAWGPNGGTITFSRPGSDQEPLIVPVTVHRAAQLLLPVARHGGSAAR